jgi:hypothetical protein
MVLDPEPAIACAQLSSVDLFDVLVAYLVFAHDQRRSAIPPAIARGVALRHARRISGEYFRQQSDSMRAIRTFVEVTRRYPRESLELALGPVSFSNTVWTTEMADTDILGDLTGEVYVGARILNAMPRSAYLMSRVRSRNELNPAQRQLAGELSESWAGTLTELIDTVLGLRPT